MPRSYFRNPSTRTTRKIREIKDRIDRHRPRLSFEGVDIADPIEEDANLLGCSCNGCAFRLPSGRVAKITVDWDEIRLAQWIRFHQRIGDAHPGLPIIDKVVFLESGFFLIIRENLDDVEFKDEYWYDDEIADGAYTSYSEFESNYIGGGRKSWGSLFRRYGDEVNTLYTEVIDQARHVGPDIIHPDDIDKVEQMHSVTRWLLNHQILICDIISDNWGVRDDGTVVIRDLGCNTAPILDASLYLPYPPSVDFSQ
jgi:hypothetical protein